MTNIFDELRNNRSQLKKINNGLNKRNDYSMNEEVDKEFYRILTELTPRTIENKNDYYAFIAELAYITVERTVGFISRDAVLSVGNTYLYQFEISKRYLNDLISVLKRNMGNIPLATFYIYQIDYVSNDLEQAPLGKEYVEELFEKTNYDYICGIIKKMIDTTYTSIYWNPQFLEKKDSIKRAVNQNINELYNLPEDLINDKELLFELYEESSNKDVFKYIYNLILEQNNSDKSNDYVKARSNNEGG